MKKNTTIIIILVMIIMILMILVSGLTVKILNTNKEKEAIQDYEEVNISTEEQNSIQDYEEVNISAEEQNSVQDYESIDLNAEEINKLIKELDILITQYEEIGTTTFKSIEKEEWDSIKSGLKAVKKELEKLKEKNSISKDEVEAVIKNVNEVKQKCIELDKKMTKELYETAKDVGKNTQAEREKEEAMCDGNITTSNGQKISIEEYVQNLINN